MRRPSRYWHVLLGVVLCAAGAIVCPPSPAEAEPSSDRVVILITPRGPYRQAADELMRRAGADGLVCELVEVNDQGPSSLADTLERLRKAPPAVIVTGGTNMTEQVLKAIPEVPVVFFMAPNALDAFFLQESPRHDFRKRVAGVASDVAPMAQVDWFQRTQPHCKRIAVLCSPHTMRTVYALQTAARQRDIELCPIEAQLDKFPAAIDALNEGKFEGVLMIPDGHVYNAPNVQRLLLWGLRNRRAVWAFSDNIVKAGALAGIHTDAKQAGGQTAEIVLEILGGKTPESIGLRYPRDVERSVNLHTADRLGIAFRSGVLTPDVQTFGGRK